MADDSNVDMGGMDDTANNSAQPADGEKPRKRRKKIEEYDKEDDFIDDTELAWEEQAAVAKDGFFVYSGPLIPPGEAARVESSAPTRGRGRGRGRGAPRGGRGRPFDRHSQTGKTCVTHLSLCPLLMHSPAIRTRSSTRPGVVMTATPSSRLSRLLS